MIAGYRDGVDKPVPRSAVLGALVHQIEMQDAVNQIIAAAHEERPLGVSALAVHGVMESVDDSELRYRINDLELVVPDGQPVRWALNWLYGAGLAERVYGPDLMANVCERAAAEGLPVYLFGSSEATLEKLRTRLALRYPGLKLAGSHASRFRQATVAEQREDLERIRASTARIVFVGLGCPRQEVWTYENRLEISLPVTAVGAAFDYLAGTTKQPAAWMQRRGLEWLHRLVKEPRRLWRRYLVLNPRYLMLLTLFRLGLLRVEPESGMRPVEPLRPG